jgi:hypothetical protein
VGERGEKKRAGEARNKQGQQANGFDRYFHDASPTLKKCVQ